LTRKGVRAVEDKHFRVLGHVEVAVQTEGPGPGPLGGHRNKLDVLVVEARKVWRAPDLIQAIQFAVDRRDATGVDPRVTTGNAVERNRPERRVATGGDVQQLDVVPAVPFQDLDGRVVRVVLAWPRLNRLGPRDAEGRGDDGQETNGSVRYRSAWHRASSPPHGPPRVEGGLGKVA